MGKFLALNDCVFRFLFSNNIRVKRVFYCKCKNYFVFCVEQFPIFRITEYFFYIKFTFLIGFWSVLICRLVIFVVFFILDDSFKTLL